MNVLNTSVERRARRKSEQMESYRRIRDYLEERLKEGYKKTDAIYMTCNEFNLTPPTIYRYMKLVKEGEEA